ncbi:MAG: hypothetical protein HY548_08745 [Elusimicrobia bacterium]|nr:hypothetical protein [Elusimicrobiota bacterium]
MMRGFIVFSFALLIFTGASASKETAFPISNSGTEPVVDYERYGSYKGVGTFDYEYVIKDAEGLAKASGLGIDPNTDAAKDPLFMKLKKRGKLSGSHWEHLDSGHPQIDFFAWTAAREDPGTRLFFTGRTLEAAGHYVHALKAYRAAMVLYPKSFCWSKDGGFTWLIAPAAWDAILNLTRRHPEIGLKLSGAFVRTEAAVNGDPSVNRVAVTPGRFVKYTEEDRKMAQTDVTKLKVEKRRNGRVACVKYSNGHWGLQVDGRPFVVKGVSYMPTKVGEHHAYWDWMTADENNNGLNDIAYETWVDKNYDGRREKGEPVVGDFKLLHDMGVNTIRLMADKPFHLPLLRELHKTYGIYVIVCEPFGAYTVHSGAEWHEGTDYRNYEQRESMMKAVRELVGQIKDEPWLLAYVLGNENNMPIAYTGVNATRTNASLYPEAYASLLNEAAAWIHKSDPHHPVGVGNVELGLLDSYAKHAPELDFIGVNSYRGPEGFGSLWAQSKSIFDRAVLITEYGCDSYWEGRGPDEDAQEAYHRTAWQDISSHFAGQAGEGNALGGMAFEWLDEWWKDTRDNAWNSQATNATFPMNFPDKNSHEEWFGLAGQGDGEMSPFLRELKKAYFTYQKLWKTEGEAQSVGWKK